MKLFLQVLMVLIFNLDLMAQIDTADFIGARYPTGVEGFYRDIEAFAGLSDKDKDFLINNPANLYLEVSVIGTVVGVKIKNEIDTLLGNRIIQAVYKLHDFYPATYRGEPIESILTISFAYRRMEGAEPVLFKPSENKMVIEAGGFIGQYAGRIEYFYGLNGGFNLAYGTTLGSQIISIELILAGNKEQNEFELPSEVVNQSNNVLGFIGIAYGREFKKKSGAALRIKSTFHYSFINAGMKEDESIYRFNGFSPGLELGFHLPVSELHHTELPYHTGFSQNGLLFYTGLQRLIMEGNQADGWWYGIGVKYVFSAYGPRKVKI